MRLLLSVATEMATYGIVHAGQKGLQALSFLPFQVTSP